MGLFVLINPPATETDAGTDFLYMESSEMAPAPVCIACGRYIGMRQLVPPIIVELIPFGLRWADISFGPVEQILISDNFRRAAINAGLRGFVRYDQVHIAKIGRRKKPAGTPPIYYLASIARSNLAIDELASGVVYEPEDEGVNRCDVCRMGGAISRFDRVVLESGNPLTEDVFFARGLPGVILVSERFKRCCDEWGLWNCVLVPADAYSVDFESPL